MDWLKLPPLNGLRAFSVVADVGSYAQAAERLNVTQAAVAQQVKTLEKHLGLALVARRGRGIELTGLGAGLARELAMGFEIISRGVDRLTDEAASRPVQITTTPAFAVEWLLPRMAEFQREHPEITLMLNTTPKMEQIRPGGIDVALRYHDRRRPRQDEEAILITDMIVIGATSLIGDRDLRDPASLTELPWLQELGTNEAGDWFTYHGVVLEQPLAVNHMPGNLIMTAVRRGDGLTYTARAFFVDDLEAGRVVELFSEPLFGVYYVETPKEHQRPEARKFVKWLQSKSETVSAPVPIAED